MASPIRAASSPAVARCSGSGLVVSRLVPPRYSAPVRGTRWTPQANAALDVRTTCGSGRAGARSSRLTPRPARSGGTPSGRPASGSSDGIAAPAAMTICPAAAALPSAQRTAPGSTVTAVASSHSARGWRATALVRASSRAWLSMLASVGSHRAAADSGGTARPGMSPASCCSAGCPAARAAAAIGSRQARRPAGASTHVPCPCPAPSPSSHPGYIWCAASRSAVSTATREGSWPGSISENVDSIAPAARLACPRWSPPRGPITLTRRPRWSSAQETARPTTPVPTTATSCPLLMAVSAVLRQDLGRGRDVVGSLGLDDQAPCPIREAGLISQRCPAVRGALLVQDQERAAARCQRQRVLVERRGESPENPGAAAVAGIIEHLGCPADPRPSRPCEVGNRERHPGRAGSAQPLSPSLEVRRLAELGTVSGTELCERRVQVADQ